MGMSGTGGAALLPPPLPPLLDPPHATALTKASAASPASAVVRRRCILTPPCASPEAVNESVRPSNTHVGAAANHCGRVVRGGRLDDDDDGAGVEGDHLPRRRPGV